MKFCRAAYCIESKRNGFKIFRSRVVGSQESRHLNILAYSHLGLARISMIAYRFTQLIFPTSPTKLAAE
jgi:hypothetical protein